MPKLAVAIVLAAVALANADVIKDLPLPPVEEDELDLFKPVLVGPEKAAIGQLIVLDASESIGVERFKWLAVGHPSPLYVDSGGAKAVFSAGTPGTYRFVLATAGPASDGICLDILTHTVTVGDAPGPGPGPGPGPTPPPPAPSKYGLVEVAREIAQKVQDPAGAKVLADNYQAVSAQISAGIYNRIEDALEELRRRNRDGLNAGQKAAWGEFYNQIGSGLRELARSGKIRTLPDHAAAFLEISKGLTNAR